METTGQNKEEQLIQYLRKILEYQIVPKSVTELRGLVKDANHKLKLRDYTEENFPSDKEFSDLLKRFPQYFNFNPDTTITIAGPNYCTLPSSVSEQPSEILCNVQERLENLPFDEADGKSCPSDLESDSESSEHYFSSEMRKCQTEENAQKFGTELIEFVKIVLKYQIAPLGIAALRSVVKDSPKGFYLSPHFEKYCSTDENFYDFLKQDLCFEFDADKNIKIVAPSYCTLPGLNYSDTMQETYDVVDGCKSRIEYESDDSESDNEIVSNS